MEDLDLSAFNNANYDKQESVDENQKEFNQFLEIYIHEIDDN